MTDNDPEWITALRVMGWDLSTAAGEKQTLLKLHLRGQQLPDGTPAPEPWYLLEYGTLKSLIFCLQRELDRQQSSARDSGGPLPH